MANRYAIKTGNWNDASVWSATSGGAGGAGVPTGDDQVYLDKNYTVTLTANADAASVSHTNGTLNLAQFRLTLGGDPDTGLMPYGFFSSTGSTTRTLNLNGGVLEILDHDISFDTPTKRFFLDGTNLTVSTNGSLIIFNQCKSDSLTTAIFATANKTLGDVVIKLGGSSNESVLLHIDSTTFKSLIILSKNSRAHNVTMGSLWTDKFVAIGASSSNRLQLGNGTASGTLYVNVGGSSYGQYLNINGISAGGGDGTYKPYIGSNSIVSYSPGPAWLTQNPPKISTLFDPLTTAPASNTNWTLGGTLSLASSGKYGGGYQGTGSIMSRDTYDIVDSTLIYEIPQRFGYYGNKTELFIGQAPDTSKSASLSNNAFLGGLLAGYVEGSTDGLWALQYRDITGNEYEAAESSPSGTDPDYLPWATKYISISVSSSGAITYKGSVDGQTWTTMSDIRNIDPDSIALFRSARLGFTNLGVWSGTYTVLGSINPNFPPSVVLNTPNLKKFGSPKPLVEFTGTDPEGNQVTYQVQIDYVNTFNSDGVKP